MAGKRAQLAATLAVLAGAATAQAATFTWDGLSSGGPSGEWSDDANWTGDVQPTSSNSTTITFSPAVASSTAPVSFVSDNDLGDDFVINRLNLDGSHSGFLDSTLSVTISGGSLLLTNPSATAPVINLVANSGSSNRAIVYDVQAPIELADNTTIQGNGTATFNLSGGVSGAGSTLTKSGSSKVTVGNTTLGSLNVTFQKSSTNVDNTLALASGATLSVGAGANDSFSVARSSVSSTNIVVGLLDLSLGASFTADVGDFDIGRRLQPTAGSNNGGATGIVKLAAVNTITATAMRIGFNWNASGVTTGEIHAGTGTTTIHTSTLTVGGSFGGVGTVTLDADGSLTLDDVSGGRAALNVGVKNNNGGGRTTGTMTLAGTFNAKLSSLIVGQKTNGGGTQTGADGVLTVGNSLSNHLDLHGNQANGVANGVTLHIAVLNIGRLDSGGSAISATTAKTSGEIIFGYLDATSAIINDGTGPAILIGSYSTSASVIDLGVIASGVLTFAGGTLDVQSAGTAPAILLANIGPNITSATSVTGTLNLTGGTMTLNNPIAAGKGSGDAVAISTISLDGGTLNMSGSTIGTAVNPITNLFLRSGTLMNVSEINGGAGTLNKTSGGVLTLEGTNTFTNDMSVVAGTLLVNGTTSDQGNYGVGEGATLGGTGTIGLATGNSITLAGSPGGNANLAPGAGIGSFDVTGNVIFGAFSRLTIEVDAAAAGNKIDLLAVSGDLDLSGASDALYLSGTLLSGERYTLATYGTIQGTFDAVYWNNVLIGSPIVGGIGNNGDYKLDYGTAGQINLVSVPEPGGLAWVGAMSALGLRRRRS